MIKRIVRHRKTASMQWRLFCGLCLDPGNRPVEGQVRSQKEKKVKGPRADANELLGCFLHSARRRQSCICHHDDRKLFKLRKYRSELHFHETSNVMFGFRLGNVFDFLVDLFNLLPELIPDDR